MTDVRVLVADDHGAIRAGLRLILEAADGVTVVGEASDGAAAVAQARALRPDVVLMDLRMPGTDGVTATRAITTELTADVLVLTTFDVDELVDAAIAAGAAGFLLKSVEPDALVDAVRRVAAGEGVLAPEVTRRVLRRLERTDPPAAADGTGLADLTDREAEVLSGLGRGLSNAGLADELGISEPTVKTHVSRVLGKLGVRSRMEAAVVARRQPPSPARQGDAP